MTATPILLISGPSGGGKSTFINQLKLGSLPPEITSSLPDNVGKWPILELNDLIKGDLSLEDIEATLLASTGCIAHYDMIMAPRLGTDYPLDPAISFLSESPLIGEIFIRPDPADLIKQFEERSKRLNAHRSPASRFWRKSIKTPLKRFSAKIRNKDLQTTQQLYLRNGWLEACYAKWDEVAGKLTPSWRITVAPAQSTTGVPSFRRIAADNPQAQPQPQS